jgi:hypothetical protein
VSSSSALSRTESLRLNRALYRLLLNISAFVCAWEGLYHPPHADNGIHREETEDFLADYRALSKAQYDFFKRSLTSENEKRELIATWKFITVDVFSWIRSASYHEYLGGT